MDPRLDAGVLVFLALVFRAWTVAEPHHLRRRAALQDEGRSVVLLLVLGGVIASVAAIVSQFTRAKGHQRWREAGQTAFGIGTVALSWLFLQTFLAQHYAHEFYGAHCDKVGEERGGLLFPATRDRLLGLLPLRGHHRGDRPDRRHPDHLQADAPDGHLACADVLRLQHGGAGAGDQLAGGSIF